MILFFVVGGTYIMKEMHDTANYDVHFKALTAAVDTAAEEIE